MYIFVLELGVSQNMARARAEKMAFPGDFG
jgi:hypothetical protein